MADILTKPLGPALFEPMPPRLGMLWARQIYGPGDDSETQSESLPVLSGSVVGGSHE
jgi:hypothetical protein